MRHDPIKYILHTLWAILGVSILILMVMVSHARAFNAGEVRSVTFTGCDTLSDAKDYFLDLKKEGTTCGTISGFASMYVREMEVVTTKGGKWHFHEVMMIEVPGQPMQVVATFEKLEDA